MARQTFNRRVMPTDKGAMREEKTNAPALETENARMATHGTFKQHAVAASQTGVNLPVGLGTGDLTFVTAPRAGEIVGTAWGLSTAATHITGTVQATINGTAVGDAVHIDTGGTAAQVDQSKPISFNEGDKLGMQITTSSAWTPTPDLAVAQVVRWAAGGTDFPAFPEAGP